MSVFVYEIVNMKFDNWVILRHPPKKGGTVTCYTRLIFSHIWRFHSHIVQLQYHMWQFFSHIWWFPYFFFITFDGFIPTLCSFNITSDSSFLTFGGSHTFFLHLTVPSSHCAVLTSHVTISFSHLVVSYFFFLTFDGFILTLCGSNIIYNSSFVTLGDSLTFFSHLTVLSLRCAVPTSHVIVLFLHLVVLLFFFYNIWRFHPYIMQFQHHM